MHFHRSLIIHRRTKTQVLLALILRTVQKLLALALRVNRKQTFPINGCGDELIFLTKALLREITGPVKSCDRGMGRGTKRRLYLIATNNRLVSATRTRAFVHTN